MGRSVKSRRCKKYITAVLTALFLFQQTLCIPVLATDISGINPTQGTGHYDIHPDFASGTMGFKHYNNFNLSQGDVANLIFALKNGNISLDRFVNLVDTQIIINGLLNTIKDGGIGGHAIFVSPQGMVVGASGVLNVGALTAIAPTANAYNKFILDSAISSGFNQGYDYENNLAILKASDMGANIDINGKIISRGDVNLYAKQINIGNASAADKAAIFAGVNKNFTGANEKLATVQAADNLFNALVATDVTDANAFVKDGGKITIQAQSVKQAATPGIVDKIVIEGKEYAIEQLMDESTGNWLDDNLLPQELRDKGVNGEYLTGVISKMLEDSIPSDAKNPNAHNETNYAIVNVVNSLLKSANDIDINATSKVDYISPNASRLFNSAIGNLIQAAIEGTSFDFEGARAKAEVNIGSNAELIAGNNVSLNSNAVANTIFKASSKYAPMIETTEELYYALGSKTVSKVEVADGAKISSKGDVKLNAQSTNSNSIKIKNPTSTIGSKVGASTGLPSIQLVVLANQTEADTKATVNSGAIIEAKNVEVDAVNYSTSSAVIESIANIDAAKNTGVAVAVNINNSNINTEAKIDGTINTNNKGTVSVNAQNLHMNTNLAKTEVTTDPPKTLLTTLKLNGILDKITAKFSSLLDLGGNSLIDTSGLPKASIAATINDSNITTNATIGKNASIHADNVNVNANTIDLTVNNALANVKANTASGASSYMPNPGVAVVVNNQNNNTTAKIESGTDLNHANVIANDTLNVNATTELPRNSATIEFLLNILQTGYDIGNLPSDVEGNLSAELDEDWDIRLLLQGITNPVNEVTADISNLYNEFKTSIKDSLGLQGFFNNWASTSSSVKDGTGLAASVISSNVVNNTNALIGDYANIQGNNVIVNAANKTIQYNAAGQISKLFIPTGLGGDNGVGGNVIVENVTNNTKAKIGNNANIDADGDVDVLSGTENQFLTVVSTGSKASGENGVSISGSVTIQGVDGETESSVGSSKIKASNLNVKVGDAKIKEIAKADDVLFSFGDEIWNDLPTDIVYEPGFDLDLSSPTISSFGGIDPDTGLLTFKDEATTIKDGISNILVAGALSQQKQSGGSSNGSSGGAVGASVNVSEFDRVVSAIINDGADITLLDSLNVTADSKIQSINVALAGAFAGGVSLGDNSGGGLLSGAKSKANGILDKLKNKLTPSLIANLTSDDKKVSVGGENYNINSDGSIKTDSGTSLKDSNGNDVKFQGSMGKEAASLDNLDASKGQTKNISAAAAGSVNAQINASTTKAEIGNATIKVGNNVNVEANQTTKSLNLGGGVSNAATVGAGAAVNFVQNSNQTTANIDGANVTFTEKSSNNNKLNVKANENNDNIQVAIGVGTTKAGSDDQNVSVSAGGSFNADVLENSVTASIENATVLNSANGKIDVDVNSENHSTSYKGAGGLAVSVGQSGNTSVGAGMGGNINLITKTTEAKIQNSTINNANNVSVSANKDKNQKTEDLISVGVGGAVIAGAQSGYTFQGAMGTDVVNNTISAIVDNSTIGSTGNLDVIDNSTIDSTGDLDVVANNNFNNGNITGALGFSSAATGVGVGVGAIVNVINNNIQAAISNNSDIKNASNVNVETSNNEDLKFLAINMGIQTGSGIPASANGIVNVVNNNIISSIESSTVNNSGLTNVIADYDNSIQGITFVGAGSNSGVATIGANVLSNVLSSNNLSQIKGSNVTTEGKLTVQSTTDETIDVIPVAAAISGSGTAAAAANVGVNVVQNATTAKIDKNDSGKKSTISANGIDVVASDITQSRSRGGTIAATGGTAAVGGSILADVYTKNVDAHIDNSTIKNGGNIKVEAKAENIFGAKNPNEITLGSLTNKVQNGEDITNSDGFENWDMTYDVAGAKNAGVSGSLISKVVVNEINSYIGPDVEIQNAGNIDVLASNLTVADVIVGNITGATTAAVGGSVFSNVNTSDVNAYIANGAKIGTVSNVGNIKVDAASSQIYKSIMFIIGAAGTAAVNGSINSNIIANSTNAYIGNSSYINSDGTLVVNANDLMDVESLNLGVSASGTAAVGGVVFVDVLANKVNAIVGKNSTNGEKQGEINVGKNVDINADDTQNFKANIALVAGSGTVAVDGVAVSNTMASEVNAGVQDTTLKTTNGSINVEANNSFNKDKETNGIGSLFNKDTINQSDVAALMPLVGIVNASGSGTASVGANVIANVVSTAVNAYVNNSTVSTTDGLNVSANSAMNTYDAIISTTFATAAGVGVTGINNIYSGETKAVVQNSTVENGNVEISADDTFNLNSVVFSIAAAIGSGAAVSAIENANVIENSVIANLINSKILNTENLNAVNVNLNAQNSVYINNILAALSVVNTGAGVNVIPNVNQFTGKTEAKIEDSSINNAATSLLAKTKANVNAGVVGASAAVTGAGVGGYTITNIFDNDINAIIDDATLTNAKSTTLTAESDIDILNGLASGGLAGIGANILANVLVNTINNNVGANISNSTIDGGSISNSSIDGGSVSTSAKQDSNINNNAYAVAGTVKGGTTVINTAVNVFENNLTSGIDNVSIDNASNISVVADSIENLTNTNMGVAATGLGASIGANAIVNVIENTTKAYINSKDKTINSTGSILVSSDDEILINNKLGLISLAAGAIGAGVDVNVINNAVIAELLTNENGQINANNLEVLANSTIGMDNSIVSAAGGIAGIAANVVVNSIGSKADFSDVSELSSSNINGSIGEIDSNSNNIQYNKNGETKTASYNLTSGTIKEGTKANVNGNIKTTGKNSNNESIKVAATNTLKGYNSDTFKISNTGVSAGLAAVGGNVLVTNMKHKANALIQGGEINANSGDVKVEANNRVKADVDVTRVTVAGAGIEGGVGYFNNSSETIAKVADTVINAGNLNISANSEDNIDIDVISVLGAAAGANVSVAIADTNNNVHSLVSGKVDIDANDVNINASNTSNLASKLDTEQGGGLTVGVPVNRTQSNAITKALINATGTVAANNMNIIASSDGINATTTMKMGSFSAITVDVANQGASVNSEFLAGIDNSNIEINNYGTTNILSGVKKSNNNEATSTKAEIKAQRTGVAVANIKVSNFNATVNSKTEAKLNSGDFTTNNLNIKSMADRDAVIGSNNTNIGAIDVQTLNMNANVMGSNIINISGNNTITENAIVKLTDDADTNAQITNMQLSLVGTAVNKSVSKVDTDTAININGTLAMGDMNVESSVNRDTYNSIESNSGAIVKVGVFEIKTSTTGESNVNIAANATNENYDNGLTVSANAVNTAESITGENSAALLAISKSSSGNTVNAANNINVNGAKINSKGEFKLAATNENRVLMKRKSTQSGVYVNSGGSLYNDITSNSKVNIQNGSNINAKDVDISSTAKIGTKNDDNIAYTIRAAGGIAETTTNINNAVSQTSEVNVDNSTVNATSDMNINVDTNSTFSQSLDASGSGFVANVDGFSNLTVTNNNKFNVLNNATVSSDVLNVSLDSSNNLKNNVNLDANHFGFRDIDGTSNITLNINNLIDNNGHIKADDLAQFDFMKKSTNILDQDVKVTVDAAIPTSAVDGSVQYNVNNKMNVAKNADIISNKDVIVNYLSGNNKITSDMVEDLTCRILFGIPIHTVNRYKRISQNVSNSLQLDGVIKAGTAAQRYMYIDKDGNIDKEKLKGFMQDEYKLVDASNVSGEQLTEDTIKGLEGEVDKLQEKINELQEQADKNDALIAEYKASLNELTNLLSEINNAISVTDAQNQFKSEVQTAIVGDGENKISQELFDKIWEKANPNQDAGAENTASITEVAKEVLNGEENIDKKVSAIETAYNTAKGKFSTKTSGDYQYSLYNGKIVLGNNDEAKTNAINNVTAGINSLDGIIADFENMNKGYKDNLETLNDSLTSVNNQIAYLKENPLPDSVIEKAAVEFANLNIPSSKIEINGITKEENGKKIINIKGDGKFILASAGLGIDNYSNRDLIFKNIDLVNGYGPTGLIIDGTNYNHLANTGTPVADNVLLETDGDILGIVINNYFDHSNPLLSNPVASDIIFNGTVAIGGNPLKIWNESGDVIFNNILTSGSKDIVATQGNFEYNVPTTIFTLNTNDRIIAGQNVNIDAQEAKINGTIKAGYGDRNLTITSDMLKEENLIVDPNTGDKNMVNLAGVDKSPYLNETNNIKVLYKDNKLLVFNTKTEGGNVNITGKVTGNGKVAYTNGYATVNIDNQTDKQLVINGLENNRQNGSFANKGTIANVINQGSNKATTTISSIGNIDILGQVKSGLGFIDGDNVSELNISGKNGVNVKEKLSETGETIATIDTYGNSSITNTGSSIVIDGIVQNAGGNLTTTNEGLGGTIINGTLKNTTGALTVTNKNGELLVNETGKIKSENGIIKLNNTTGTGTTIKGLVDGVNGDIEITNENGLLLVDTTGIVQNTGNNLTITNSGNLGTEILGLVSNDGKNLKVENKTAGLLVDGTIQNTGENLDVINSGANGAAINGLIKGKEGNTTVENTNGNLLVSKTGIIQNEDKNLTVTNKGDGGATISGSIKNTGNKLTLENQNEKLYIDGSVENYGNNLEVKNSGSKGVEIEGIVKGEGNNSIVSVTNTNGNLTINQNAEVTNKSNTTADNLLVQNDSSGVLDIFGKIFNKNKGNTKVTNINQSATSEIKVNETGSITNTNGTLFVQNNGGLGITIDGLINNKLGEITVKNLNETNTSGILISTIGRIINEDGKINITNKGQKETGLDVDGLINAINKDIVINNQNSNIEIGEYATDNDNYILANKGNIEINQTNGNILNGIIDPDTNNKNQNHDLGNPDHAYKTLINAGKNLTITTNGGNIGKDTHNLENKESGFGINASTRDYTESINVNVKGKVKVDAKNNGNALVNLRAKNSDLKVDNIKSDGNIMLTAIDWKQKDEETPNPNNEEYYRGYSIINAANNKNVANVEGRNISLISSNNIGENGNSFTYNQLENGTISAMAENDLYITGMGNNDNIWQLIAKRGNLGLDLTGNAIIREITSGGNLKIVSKAANLTIYDLGKLTNLLSEDDDILYPHDKILMSSVVPDATEIHVLDINPATRIDPNNANSTLNIYNAYIEGKNDGTADVILRADNVIAHAYDAASSNVSNALRPNGFDAKENRTYANDFTDPNAIKDLTASGFNTVGEGEKLVFDIQGVSPDNVKDAGGNENQRNYKAQDVVQTIEIFDNPVGFKETVYKAKDVTLSLNSSENAPLENRGMELLKFYTDNAYVDTKDLNLHMSDAFITNYAEFRNGNREGEPGGFYIDPENGYRWLTIVDNDYHRNISNDFGIPVTSQLYTKLTGSFALSMGNLIALETKAPVVHYNPYEVVNLPRTENSFYRLTYKDDKIQKTTTTPEFADIDKSTYKPTKREYIRFNVLEDSGVHLDKKKKQKTPRIIAIVDISRGGIAVTHDGSLKVGEKMVVSLSCHGIDISPEVEVVRVSGNNAGMKFINLDKSTANKILYMNMFMADDKTLQTSSR